jgi:hypothetical protein
LVYFDMENGAQGRIGVSGKFTVDFIKEFQTTMTLCVPVLCSSCKGAGDWVPKVGTALQGDGEGGLCGDARRLDRA